MSGADRVAASAGDLRPGELEALRARVAELEREAVERERADRAARVLVEVERELAGALDLDRATSLMATAALRLFPVRRAALFQHEPAVRALVCVAAAGASGAEAWLGRTLPAATAEGEWAAPGGRLTWSSDLLADPRPPLPEWAIERIQAEGLRMAVAVPLVARGVVLGALLVGDAAGRVFTGEEIRLLTAFAAQAAVVLENARLFAETRERLRESETLLAVGRVLSQHLVVDEAMRQVCREVAHAVEADMAGAYFLDARKEALVPMAGYHVPKDLRGTFMSTPFPVGRFPFLREAWERQATVWTSDYPTDPRFDQEFLKDVRPRALLFVPTLIRKEIMGGLFLVWWTPGRTFTPAELRLIEGVASQVGLALENVELARQTQEKLIETERLLSVGRSMSSTLELQPLLRHLLRQVARTIEADSVGVWLADPASGRLQAFTGYHVPPPVVERLRGHRIDPEASPFYAEAVARRRVMASRNVPEDPRIPADLKAAAPHRGQLFAPIMARERVIGALIAVWWDRPPVFTDRQAAFVEAVGSQAGVAIENARLFQENRRKLEELSVLYELSRAVTGQLDVGQLVEAVHHGVGRVLDARNMEIFLYDQVAGELEVALRTRDGQPDAEPTRRHAPAGGLAGRVLERRRAIRTSDHAEACRQEGAHAAADEPALPHWLGVPLVAADQPLGVLVIRSASEPFTEGDERLLANIAGLAALAVRSARLYEERSAAYRELSEAQDRLVQTEKIRALGEMAAGVAHDFNNLLAVIAGRTELLLRTARDPRLVRGLEIVHQSALEGAQTVRRIQEFTRTRRTRPFGRVDLGEVIREVVELTRPRWKDEAQGGGIAYEVVVEGGPVPAVAGRPEELREAFTSLLANALEAMPAGGRLVFRLATERGEPELVAVSVTDTGGGMSEETVSRVFEPFFTTKGPQGSGLGLAVVWGIVSRHGGTVAVASRPGQGSTFTVRLPVARAASPERMPEAPRPPSRRARLLVIDDETQVREVLRDLLVDEGYVVVEAAEGASGLALCEAEPVDLVLTDVSMPGMSGWEVAAACRARFPGVPVGLITGWGDQLDPDELLRQRVRFVLAKPFQAGDVLRQVAEALAPPSARRDPHP